MLGNLLNFTVVLKWADEADEADDEDEQPTQMLDQEQLRHIYKASEMLLLDLHALNKAHCVEFDLPTDSKKSKEEVCFCPQVDCVSLANKRRTVSVEQRSLASTQEHDVAQSVSGSSEVSQHVPHICFFSNNHAKKSPSQDVAVAIRALVNSAPSDRKQEFAQYHQQGDNPQGDYQHSSPASSYNRDLALQPWFGGWHLKAGFNDRYWSRCEDALRR